MPRCPGSLGRRKHTFHAAASMVVPDCCAWSSFGLWKMIVSRRGSGGVCSGLFQQGRSRLVALAPGHVGGRVPVAVFESCVAAMRK